MDKHSNGNLAALRIVFIYLVVGCLWILLSDKLVGALVKDPSMVTRLSIAKGWVYVFATGWMLYALIKKDISAIRSYEEAQRESEEKYRRIVETAQEGIWEIDAGLITTYVNQHMSDMLGYTVEEMIGRSVYDFIPPDDAAVMLGRFEHRQKGLAEQYDTLYRRKDGSELWAIVSATPIRGADGGYQGSFAMLTDITDRRKEAEREKALEAHKREFYRRTILAATEGKLVVTNEEEIKKVAGPSIASWEILNGEDLGSIRAAVRETAESLGMSDLRVSDFILCVGEATTNAYKHAGGGAASLHRLPDGLLFVVCDHGQGIEALTLPEVALVRGYSTARSLGMGYKAMISIADTIYLATDPTGTTVGIEMAFQAKSSPSILPDLW